MLNLTFPLYTYRSTYVLPPSLSFFFDLPQFDKLISFACFLLYYEYFFFDYTFNKAFIYSFHSKPNRLVIYRVFETKREDLEKYQSKADFKFIQFEQNQDFGSAND